MDWICWLQSQCVRASLVPLVFPRWLSRWRGSRWRSVSGAHLCVLDSSDVQGCRGRLYEATQLGAGVTSVTRVKEPVMGLGAVEHANWCFAPLEWLNVERFTAQCTFCTSRVLIFLKPPLIFFIMKPYIVKSAFSWHCVSLLHNTICNSVCEITSRDGSRER